MRLYTVVGKRNGDPTDLLDWDREHACDIAYARALATAWRLKRLLNISERGEITPGEFFYSEVEIRNTKGEVEE